MWFGRKKKSLSEDETCFRGTEFKSSASTHEITGRRFPYGIRSSSSSVGCSVAKASEAQLAKIRKETVGFIFQSFNLIQELSVLRGNIQLNPQPGDLNDCVRSTLDGTAVREDVRLELELRDLPDAVLDAEQIQKVVANLVINAQDAMPGGGVLRLATRSAPGKVELEVRDSGEGISEEFLTHSLFRPFQSTKKNGMGIGLYHCRAIMEAHQGSIKVESAPGEGAAFTLQLPAYQANIESDE